MIPLPKPAIVNNEKLNTRLSRSFGQRHLILGIDVEIRRFPGIVQHFSCFVIGQNIIILIVVQMAAHFPKPAVTESADKYGRLKCLASSEYPCIIKIINAARYLHMVERRLLRYDLPVPTPGKRSKPYPACVFRCMPVIHSKPRISVAICKSSPGFQHFLAFC
ncbi:hypothetical protein D3C77_386750 [compost metagenome]